jgi:hypothetical protein
MHDNWIHDWAAGQACKLYARELRHRAFWRLVRSAAWPVALLALTVIWWLHR